MIQPVVPTTFDAGFRRFQDLVKLKSGRPFGGFDEGFAAAWENYATYNATLDGLRPLIAAAAGLKTVRLIDARSFCYILAVLLKQQVDGVLKRTPGTKDDGRILGGREKAIAAMRYAVETTVRSANGQTVERTVKNKELRMSGLDLQGDRCALTEIPFNFDDKNGDKSLLGVSRCEAS